MVGPTSRHFRVVTNKVLVERVKCCEIVALSIFGTLLSVQMLSLIFHMLCGQNVKRLATEDLEHATEVGSGLSGNLWCHQIVRAARGNGHSAGQ